MDGNSHDDLEQLLITYLTTDNEKMPAKKRRDILNRTQGNRPADYATKTEVRAEVLIPFWEHELRDEGLVRETDLRRLRQGILFKYSPFTSLSRQQSEIIDEVLSGAGNDLIEGSAGTGKTVVLTNLVARLSEESRRFPKVGVVVKANWRKSAQRIFSAYSIGKNVDVGSAYQIIKSAGNYDMIIVDEAHRLRWGCSKQNHFHSDIFDKSAPRKNELFLLGQKTARLVLLYDSLQAIKPSDIPRSDFERYVKENRFKILALSKQFRVQVGDSNASYTSEDYINGIKSALQLEDAEYDKRVFQNPSPDAYFGIVDSISDLFAYINRQKQFYPASENRVLAGYARPWGSKRKRGSKNYTEFDWVQDALNQWKWNSTNENWLALPGSMEEIGSIHAIQGMDLDYVGVIVANDLSFADGKVVGVKSNYHDINGTPALKTFSQEELTAYLKNIYYVLLSRGISGIRVYFEDKALKHHFMKEVGLI